MSTVRRRQTRCVGLWLDHSGATIVSLEEGGEPVVQHVESSVESHYRFTGGRKSGTHTQEVADEKRVDRRREHQLDRYYERLAGILGEAGRVLILGPGEAKLGLERVLERERDSGPRRITVKTADKMTERQLVAEVRRFFSRA